MGNKSKKTKLKPEEYGPYLFASANETDLLFAAQELFKECNVTKESPHWWKTLGYIWSICENLNSKLKTWNEVLSNYTSKEQAWFMGNDDFKEFKKLPETIEIYRGFPELDLYGMSYSLDKKIAMFFAKRGAKFEFKKSGKRSRGSVAHFSIEKKYTFAFVNKRKEKEIVILEKNWEHLKLLETPSFHWTATPKKKTA